MRCPKCKKDCEERFRISACGAIECCQDCGILLWYMDGISQKNRVEVWERKSVHEFGSKRYSWLMKPPRKLTKKQWEAHSKKYALVLENLSQAAGDAVRMRDSMNSLSLGLVDKFNKTCGRKAKRMIS